MLTREQYFPGHAPGEQVALFIRRHWMAFFPWIVFGPTLYIIFTATVLGLWAPESSFIRASHDYQVVAVVLTSVFQLSLFFAMLRAWMSYYLDVTIVTERRLVDINQQGIFVRRISEQSLLRVQDVSARQQGFFHHALNYGHLFIETAGSQPNFEIHNISRPNDVAKTILDLHDRLVGAGGHEVEELAGEGSLEPPGPMHPPARRMVSHPLEGLRQYFPEPGLADEERRQRVVDLAEREQAGTVDSSNTAQELREGEIINVQSDK